MHEQPYLTFFFFFQCWDTTQGLIHGFSSELHSQPYCTV
jgi:hypothetical protein